jgi:hemerythrin-like domain-containing protein
MTAMRELKAHTAIEEKMFYPAIRRSRNDAETHDLVDEAREEHHAAKLLIAELEVMKAGDSALKAKFTVLAEMVKHHIAEEEGEMFPLARVGSLDLQKLGREMKHAKARFFQSGGRATRALRARPPRGRRARRGSTAKAGTRRS